MNWEMPPQLHGAPMDPFQPCFSVDARRPLLLPQRWPAPGATQPTVNCLSFLPVPQWQHLRTLRSAWQPAFSPAALASYPPATEAALDRLVSRLGPMSDSCEVVELSKELTGLTLDVVGQAAYG